MNGGFHANLDIDFKLNPALKSRVAQFSGRPPWPQVRSRNTFNDKAFANFVHSPCG